MDAQAPQTSGLRFSWPILLLLVGVAGALYFLGRRDGSEAVRESTVDSATTALLKARHPLYSTLAGLLATEQRAVQDAKRLGAAASSSGAKASALADSVSRLLALLPDTSTLKRRVAQLIEEGRATLDTLNQRCQAIASALSACQQRAALAQAHLVTADSLLQVRQSVETCRILFTSCPSRTTSFGLGAGTLLVLYLFLHH